MGLRSRRSSTATLRTINTVNGAGGGGPQSPRESIAEVAEEDEGEPEAGIVEMGTKQDDRRARLNPKASNSWLRWNSPTPSFPRGKGKGKEVIEDRIPGRRTSTIGDGDGGNKKASEDEAPVEDDDGTTTVKLRQPPATENVNAGEQAGDTIKASQSGPGTIPPPSERKAGGWFTKNPPPAPPPNSHEPDSITSSTTTTTASPAAPSPPPNDNTDPSLAPASPQIQPTNGQDAKSDGEPTRDVIIGGSEGTKAAESPGGWKEYLTWGRKGASRLPIPSHPEPSIESTNIVPTENADIPDTRPVTHEPTTELAEPTEMKPPSPITTEEDSPDHPTTQKPSSDPPRKTWGSFLYGIVIPQTGPQTSGTVGSENAETVEPVNPTSATTEQPPVHFEVDPTTEIERQVLEQPNESTKSVSEPTDDSTLKPPISTKPRQNSQASTTGGWLNYLAFRASQKKVENPPSSIATEEVMDLSNDPNFPVEPPTPLEPKPSKPNDNAKPGNMPPPSGLPDKKKKRLSTSSIKSATSVVPIPPSPQNQSKGGTAASTPAPSQKISALPAPPQVPATQPNLVIPSFSTTFDRPPRLFLPPKPASPALQPTQPGLAWRALGAVGSYVYPGQEKVEEKAKIVPQETRGLKEGREIGTDLPRRIGLAGGDPDDGWKNVKRVVVVGVHGWFPAKIVNSVIGEPTGTSSKFANMMGQAVKKFFDDKGIDDIRLTLIPLEGEGTIEHRVDRYVIAESDVVDADSQTI
jgi:hypothetical protein